MAEKVRMELIIEDRKGALKDHLEHARSILAPAVSILTVMSTFKKKEFGNPLLKVGSALAIDFLVGQKLLKRANWLVKLLVMPVLKLFSMKMIERT